MIETGINPAAAAYNRNNSLDNNWFSDERHSRRGSVLAPAANGYDDGRRGLSPDRGGGGMKLLDTGARRLYESSDNLIERFTVLLNLCIEDIEHFCAEVREIRGNERPGVTMEDLQATDFTQIFQKFKLSFNLLVRKRHSL